MEDVVQVKAVIPRALKRQLYIRLRQRDEKFNAWLRQHIETWLADTSQPLPEVTHAPADQAGADSKPEEISDETQHGPQAPMTDT